LVKLRFLVTSSFLLALTVAPVGIGAASAQAATVACGATQCVAPVPCNTSVGACFQPALNSRWQYQLQAARTSSGACDTS